MKFVARLVTERKLERPVQRFIARDQDIEATAKTMLTSATQGDRVIVFEMREIPVQSFTFMSDGTVDQVNLVTQERKCIG